MVAGVGMANAIGELIVREATPLERKIDQILEMLSAVIDRQDRHSARLDAMDARFDAMDARLDAMEARFDRIEARLDAMDARVQTLTEEFRDFRRETEQRLGGIEAQLVKIHIRDRYLASKVGEIEMEMNVLKERKNA